MDLGWIWGAVPLLLRHPAVDGDGGEVLLHQQLRQRNAALHRLHEDHHLRPSGVINEGSLALLGVIRPLIRVIRALAGVIRAVVGVIRALVGVIKAVIGVNKQSLRVIRALIGVIRALSRVIN